jgi:hypothetical protein
MSHDEKQVYLEAIRRRYRKSGKEKKAKILDEFCAVCQYNRKYAIRLLRRRRLKKYHKPGRKPRYEAGLLLASLKAIWFATDQMCSKRLKQALREWLPHYEGEAGLLDDGVRGQLLSLSASTIDRFLKPLRVKWPRKGLSGTKPGRLLKNQIPVKTHNWDVSQPGFLEADTVAHCGNSLIGDFVWSMTLTDIYSTWTENRALWNKGAHGVVEAIHGVEKILPFEILGFDCDNGSEFLNHHLVRYFMKRDKPVQFTRSRPYHKNDNAHVEQKNWTHVRHLFGYDRIDNNQCVGLMNDLYANEWSDYQNHFCPTMKLIEKKRINSKYYKRYDVPQTPYQRLMASEHISQGKKDELRKHHESLNPFALKRAIERKLRHIFKFISVTSNVRQRL